MTGYELRDRADGTVDLVENIPTVIATFVDRIHADRICGILVEHGDAETPPFKLVRNVRIGGVRYSHDPYRPISKPMWDEYAEPASQPTEAPHDHAMTRAELHGSVAQAVQPTPVQDEPAGPVASSSHVDFDLAFERIDQGEKIGAVADDLRVPLHLLKSKWAKHIADNTPATIEDVQTNLPAVSGEPDLETAFLRIRAGETVKDVAADMGFKFPSLRGKWANKQRRRSDGDTESCRLCDRQFKPCADSDGLCARCTHG